MNFEDVYKLADQSGSESAFNRRECETLYNLLMAVDKNGLVVEIGMQFGRSATIIGAVAKEKQFDFYGIDNWQEDVSPDAKRNIEEVLIGSMKLPIKVINKDSREAWKDIEKTGKAIDLIHIDGDHEFAGVMSDCENYLPRVKKGGHVCFDDYGHDSLPGVYLAVSEYMAMHPEWKFIGRYGEKLGVFVKI